MEKAKYDTIGIGYNTTRKADPYLVKLFLKYLAPEEGKTYLDIGCGTGNYTVELQKSQANFIGVDPSVEMLKVAKAKNTTVRWKLGTSEEIPLETDAVDGAIASLTIHHWKDLGKAFKEISRVVKKEGKLIVFTATPEQMKGYWLCHYFPRMLSDSMQQMPTLEKVKQAMENAKIQIENTYPYTIQPDLKDKFLYCGKQQPELYFNTQIRKGISSFSSLANKEEVGAGLDMLRKDIDSAKIKAVMHSYENNIGDYLYIVARIS
ncbi:class I SAM-dependent methyltransferase [Tenacibaculum amylolyticum]|uniref:class I SAM-dependent methyltransferase n=1 Tax=Tenacibaculum amylolyticum TaxID=104269 RepID=UPI0038936957